MWIPSAICIDPIKQSVGAAVLSSIATECLSSWQPELYSEILAWMILPSLFKVLRQVDATEALKPPYTTLSGVQPAPSVSLWAVGVGVVVFSAVKTEIGMVVFLPALTPLLLGAQKYLGFEYRVSTSSSPRFFAPFVTTVWGTALVALLAIGALSDWDFVGHAFSAIPVTALLVVYLTLTPRYQFCRPFDIESAIHPLSWRAVSLLLFIIGVETITFGLPSSGIVATLVLGLSKASTWYFLVQSARHSSWLPVTALETFSVVSTRDPFTMTSGLQALTHVGVSLIALGQVIYLLPSRAGTSKLILWTFCLVPLVPYLANAVAVQNQQSSLAYSQPRVHPVEVLIQNAKAEFDSMLARQSRTYAEAHSEYRRRYGIEPPPGFEAWYYFAKANDSPIIDDYDTIYGSVSPLWRLSGREVRDIMNQVQQAPDSELWACIFSGHQATTHCHHPYRAFDRHIQFLFDKLLGDLRGVLPDVKFLVNHFDEPRVVIPGQSSPGSTSNPQFNITDLSRRPVWDILTKACTRTGEKNQDNQKKQAVETFGLPFVADRPAAMDLCRQPEYSEMHGLMMSPSVFRLIEGTVPVLSTGAPSTMGDILYPSPAYFEPEFQYTDTQDVDWDRKRNNLYWAGSTTGGVASSSGSYTNSVSDSWHFYHRQRFVSLAQNLQRRQHSYLHETSGIIHRVKTTFLNTHLFDVAFTRIFQCGWRQCRQQRAYFKTKSWANKDQAFRSRLVFDIDGNGISGRYYKLLASRSAPLKQTLLREWHDDRLVPWVHYIPVSQGMEELPELVTYLTSTESGRENAREIAEQGRDWFAKAFRDVDLSVYVYRLVLELARLQDPRREGRWELV